MKKLIPLVMMAFLSACNSPSTSDCLEFVKSSDPSDPRWKGVCMQNALDNGEISRTAFGTVAAADAVVKSDKKGGFTITPLKPGI
jgi:hypothetical protein